MSIKSFFISRFLFKLWNLGMCRSHFATAIRKLIALEEKGKNAQRSAPHLQVTR